MTDRRAKKKMLGRDEYQIVLGLRLRHARLRKGMTQKQAAERCGVSLRSWSLYENGEVNIPAYVAYAASCQLGMSEGWA